LMGIYAGDQAGLVNHLSKHTCLLVGLSLEDETLRSVLMQAARLCPGNFHYYIRYLDGRESLDDKQRTAIRLANFKVYNLVTLFLTAEEIKALGEMLDTEKCRREDLCEFAEVKGIPTRFRFYVTGSLGAGKSTTINNFRNLVVVDEWLDERPPVLAKDWEELLGPEKKEADEWIADQFRDKNAKLRREKEGIFMLDRAPLDPLAFTPGGEWSSKAKKLLDKICPGHKWQVEDGHVILLNGDPHELALRMLFSQRKHYTEDKLKAMQTTLGNLYGGKGVVRFDTCGLSPCDVAKRVAEIVHLEEYEPCDLHSRLEEIRKGEIVAAE